jgi:hypothetical protein
MSACGDYDGPFFQLPYGPIRRVHEEISSDQAVRIAVYYTQYSDRGIKSLVFGERICE